MSTAVHHFTESNEPTAWLRLQVQSAETRRSTLMFGQCGHLTAPEFDGWVILWDPETRTCADCIRNMTHGRTTPTCDRCGAGGELHPCLARSAHTRFALGLCAGCLALEVGSD